MKLQTYYIKLFFGLKYSFVENIYSNGNWQLIFMKIMFAINYAFDNTIFMN